MNRKHGFAIPVVLLFCICTLAFASAMFFFRKEVKQQNVMTFNFLQANFLAQASLQHMLMKISILPQESYDCGTIQRGFCPLQAVLPSGNPTSGQKSEAPMTFFISDVNTQVHPWIIPAGQWGFNASDWEYKVASMVVIAAYTDPVDSKMIQTVQITSFGTVNDARGGRGKRTEMMTKTVELARKLN